jgi:hypothetical protein
LLLSFDCKRLASLLKRVVPKLLLNQVARICAHVQEDGQMLSYFANLWRSAALKDFFKRLGRTKITVSK